MYQCINVNGVLRGFMLNVDVVEIHLAVKQRKHKLKPDQSFKITSLCDPSWILKFRF